MHALGLPSAHPNTRFSISIPRSSDCTANRETVRAHERALLEHCKGGLGLRLRLLCLRKHMLLLLCHLRLHLMSQKASEERDTLLYI